MTENIFSNPYLTGDFARRPCFNILIGLTFISLCLPTRYAHTSTTRTIATSLPMRVLDVEPGRFHGPKCRLYFPATSISRDGFFRPVEADENLKCEFAIQVFTNIPSYLLAKRGVILMTLLLVLPF